MLKEKKQSKYLTPLRLALGTALFSSALLEMTRSYLRPTYGKGKGILPELFGMLPNFLAGFGIPFLFLGAYYTLQVLVEVISTNPDEGHFFNDRHLRRGFAFITLLNTLGLILWEFSQLRSKLTFDLNDILATIVGGLACYYWFIRFGRN